MTHQKRGSREGLIRFIWFVLFIWLVSFNQTNKMSQKNQIDQTDRLRPCARRRSYLVLWIWREHIRKQMMEVC